MKCPECMEKRILDDVPVKNLCPKCGSEMDVDERWTAHGSREYSVDVFVCPNPKCGHESKVGGEG